MYNKPYMDSTNIKYQAKAILSDHDGTAVDSDAIHFMTFNQIAADINGSSLSQSEWWEHCPGGYSAIWQLFARKGVELGRELDIQESDFTQLAKDTYYKNLDHIKPRPGMPEMLEHYKKSGLAVAIVSGSPTYLIEKSLAVTGLKPYVDAIFSSDTIRQLNGRKKPAPDPYLLAAKQMGVPIDLCVAFEDSVSGCKSAYEAGIPVFQFRCSPTLDNLADRSPFANNSSILRKVSIDVWSFANDAFTKFDKT